VKRFVLLIASIAISAVLNGCSNSKSTPADAPPDLKATAGDGIVTLTWTAAPDVEYWIFYGAGSAITSTNWLSLGGRAVTAATSPYTVSGLTNGNTYSFSMNGRKNGGPGGIGAPTQVAVPRFAGSAWVVGSPLGTGRLNGISATAGGNVIVGSGGVIYAGVNGTVPVAQTNPTAPADLNAVISGGLGLAAVGAAGTVVFSTDTLAWTTKTSGTVADLYALASPGTGALVAVGAGGTVIATVDGTTWTTSTSATTKNLYAAAYGISRYVAVGAEGTVVTSTDGATWQLVPVNTPNDLRAVALGVISTTTGSGTTAVTTTASIFVAMGVAGTLLTSSDGLTWTVQTPMSTNTINAVVYSSQFVAVGNAGSIYTSADGITWQARLSGTANDLTALARTSSGYVAVGAAGTNLTSF
jgi:hypothetical protein